MKVKLEILKTKGQRSMNMNLKMSTEDHQNSMHCCETSVEELVDADVVVGYIAL
jgi:glycerol dehydrogenase-like iron-containing ADH family enzyme